MANGCVHWVRLRPAECRPQPWNASFALASSGLSRATRPPNLPNLGGAKRRRSTISAASGSGPPEWPWIETVRPLAAATQGRARRSPGLKTQVHEVLLAHRLRQNRRDYLQFATAVRAVFQVDLEDPLEQLGPAQPHRAMVHTGRIALCRWSNLCGGRWVLRHYQRAQLGVGCQYAGKADQVRPRPAHRRRQEPCAPKRRSTVGDRAHPVQAGGPLAATHHKPAARWQQRATRAAAPSP